MVSSILGIARTVYGDHARYMDTYINVSTFEQWVGEKVNFHWSFIKTEKHFLFVTFLKIVNFTFLTSQIPRNGNVMFLFS